MVELKKYDHVNITTSYHQMTTHSGCLLTRGNRVWNSTCTVTFDTFVDGQTSNKVSDSSLSRGVWEARDTCMCAVASAHTRNPTRERDDSVTQGSDHVRASSSLLCQVFTCLCAIMIYVKVLATSGEVSVTVVFTLALFTVA